MKFSKKELYSFTRYAYRLLKNKPELFSIAKMRENRGLCVYDEEKQPDAIITDYREAILPSLIHEVVHYKNRRPDKKDETITYEMERNLINQLSKRQIAELLFRYAEVLKKNT